MEYAIFAENLTKRFGDLTAVDGITLRIKKGEIFGLVGPNGAGKTTTVNLLAGLLRPTSGKVEILGMDIEGDNIEVKRLIGVMPEGLALYEQLTGEEYLHFVGRMYGMDGEEIAFRSEELLRFMGLEDFGGTYICEYSTGMKKKLSLASIFLHDPEVLLLDEPFEGIDPISLRRIREVLKQMRDRGATIFLTSHVLPAVEKVCTEVGIIHKGKLIFTSPTEQIRKRFEDRADLEDVFLSLVVSEMGERGLPWLRDTKAG